MSAAGRLADEAVAEDSSLFSDKIVAGGSLADKSWFMPVWMVIPEPLISLQVFAGSGWTVCQLPLPAALMAKLLLTSMGCRCRKTLVLLGRVVTPAAAVLDQLT